MWKIEEILEEIIQNKVSLEGSPTIKVTLLLQLLLLMVDAQDIIKEIHILLDRCWMVPKIMPMLNVSNLLCAEEHQQSFTFFASTPIIKLFQRARQSAMP